MRIFSAPLLITLWVTNSLTGAAQAPQVPHKMQFAGMTLTIRDDARKEIQKDVDAMTLSPRHFNIKAERAKTYFPIIEKVFQDEQVPDDFKYLVLQESSLIADAVSVSNAVGFWQFKDFTAIEMGLRVDREIDERMNIVSSSRGAARYFKKNNTFFNNWLYALQAYQMGAGAVLRSVKDSESGAKHMEITSKTYWYVKKFLAHKVAYEEAVKGPAQFQVTTYEHKGKKRLADLAKDISVDEETLKTNNKWVKSGMIPDDRTYMILIPVAGVPDDYKLATLKSTPQTRVNAPAIGSVLRKNNKVNGILTIVAIEGENPTRLAARAGIALSEFLRWNDISISDPVYAGQVFFLARKRVRASTAYHTAQPGEDLWVISQKYGVQLKKLRKYNRLESNNIKPGETIWLTAKRPKDADQTKTVTEVAEVDKKETFNWSDNVEVSSPVVVPIVTPVPEPVIEITQPETTPESIDSVKADSVVVPEADKPIELKSTDAEQKKDSIISFTVKKTEHVVQPKETLYAIAHLYNIGVMDLVNWNNLDLQAGIKPGQILKLTEGQSITTEKPVSNEPHEIIHEVKSSDTLYSVARKYSVTIKQLMEWNSKTDFNVTVGEKLRIIQQ